MRTFKELKKAARGKLVYVKCGTVYVQVTLRSLRDLCVLHDMANLRFQYEVFSENIAIYEIDYYTPVPDPVNIIPGPGINAIS